MSCMVLKDSTLAEIANKLEKLMNQKDRVWFGVWEPSSLHEAFADCRGPIYFDRNRIFRKLCNLNLKAYAGRYREDFHPEEFPDEYLEELFARVEPVPRVQYSAGRFLPRPVDYNFIRQLDCLIYQLEEDVTAKHPVMLALKELQQDFMAYIVRNSPDYNRKSWGE